MTEEISPPIIANADQKDIIQSCAINLPDRAFITLIRYLDV